MIRSSSTMKISPQLTNEIGGGAQVGGGGIRSYPSAHPVSVNP
jgi:hypothetical protein